MRWWAFKGHSCYFLLSASGREKLSAYYVSSVCYTVPFMVASFTQVLTGIFSFIPNLLSFFTLPIINHFLSLICHLHYIIIGCSNKFYFTDEEWSSETKILVEVTEQIKKKSKVLIWVCLSPQPMEIYLSINIPCAPEPRIELYAREQAMLFTQGPCCPVEVEGRGEERKGLVKNHSGSGTAQRRGWLTAWGC